MSAFIVFYIGVSDSSLLFPTLLFVTCLERLFSEYAYHSLHTPKAYLGHFTYSVLGWGFPL
jgi:hypothetical protein